MRRDTPRTRCIVMSDPSGFRESVVFTENRVAQASEFCAPGQTVDIDVRLPLEMPAGFPLDYILDRRL